MPYPSQSLFHLIQLVMHIILCNSNFTSGGILMVLRTNIFKCNIESLIKQTKYTRPIFRITTLQVRRRLVMIYLAPCKRNNILKPKQSLFQMCLEID